MIVGVGTVLQGLDGAENRAQADYVALGVRVEQPFSLQCTVVVFFFLPVVGLGRLPAPP
jgi:hypothetical protein